MYDPSKPYKKEVLELIKSTWETPYVSVKEGAYPIVTKKFSYPEVHHTDGIGTKGVYHWGKRTFREAVVDALAMNLNDLAITRAVPYALQNHIVLPKDDHEAILEIVKTLAGECQKRNIAMTGGETSIHDNTEGMDVSITVAGFIKQEQPNEFQPGDLLVGIKSVGLHSNGFTKVRKVFRGEFKSEFIFPTVIYLDRVLKLCEAYEIHGMMHITGGAFTKLKGLLRGQNALISRNHTLPPLEIFKEIYTRGVTDEEMYRTFNCGIGFVLGAAPDHAREIVRASDAAVIGEVAPGNGRVKIESAFSNRVIEL